MAAKVEGVIWLASVFLRFLWVLYPQTGYLHPDEYFQSPEITSGDVFGFRTLRTWEFNETFPVRSILFPHLTTGIPFMILNKLHAIYDHSSWILNTWTLVVLPRLVYCGISLLIDLSTYKISLLLEIDPAPVLCVIGTSYVTLVFHTRPLSNSLESVLFSLLLWALAAHNSSSENALDRQSKTRNLGIGILLAAGVWNRPTFLAFAVFPGLSWCYRFYKDSVVTKLSRISMLTGLVRHACFIVCGATSTAVLFIAMDSVYFGYFSTNKGQLAITPLNFIRYNLDTSRIKEHGLHPRFTHFLVNMPLMFGILAVTYFYFILVMIFKRDFTSCLWKFLIIDDKDVQELSNEKSKQKKFLLQKTLICKLLIMCVFVPVGLLSLIPHQEPRFLAPVLIPLAILFGQLIAGPKGSSFAMVSWFMWNVLGCVMFGILHQGGMYSSLGYLQKHLASSVTNSPELISIHLVFSNTYMPPRYLLAWSGCVDDSKDCQSKGRHLYLHDLAGQNKEDLVKWLETLVESEKKKPVDNTKFEVFLICPSTLRFNHPLFSKERQFFPHVSMENPPDLGSLLQSSNSKRTCEMNSGQRYLDNEQYCMKNKDGNIAAIFSSWIKSELSLNLYKLQSSIKPT